MKQQKGVSTTLSVLLITLLITVIGGIVIYKYISAPTEKPSAGETGESQDETADWKTYVNEKYQYSFKYPLECYLGPLPGWCKTILPEERPSECLCRLNETNEDYILLQGDISGKGWPHIEIHHHDTSLHNPPVGIDIITWLKEKSPYRDDVPEEVNFEMGGIPAVKVHIPGVISDQSETVGQAYSVNVIYFLRDEKLFLIRMLDVDSEGGKEFYNLFLPTFRFLE